MLQQFGQTSASIAETPWLAAVKFELHHGLGVSFQGRRNVKSIGYGHATRMTPNWEDGEAEGNLEES